MLSFLIRGTRRESLSWGWCLSSRQMGPWLCLPLRLTPGTRAVVETRQAVWPIRLPLPAGMWGASALGPPGGISLLLTSLPGASSSFLQHSSRLPCSMPQSSANGVHVTTMCQTNLGQPPHSLPRALGILWNGEYSNAFLGETAGFQPPKYYDLS